MTIVQNKNSDNHAKIVTIGQRKRQSCKKNSDNRAKKIVTIVQTSTAVSTRLGGATGISCEPTPAILTSNARIVCDIKFLTQALVLSEK